MSDSFNPHEILSRLRAKPVGIHVTNQTNSVNHPNNVVSNHNPVVIPGSPHIIPSTPMNHGGQNGGGNISPTKSLASSKTIKTPVTLTLTPAQRQDNLTMRNELEKEVKRLQEEIHQLKQENKQLREDKTDVERQLIDFKTKHDDVVTKLRGKIAQLTFQQQKSTPHTTVSEPTGKLYPPNPTFSASKTPASASKANHVHHAAVLASPQPPLPSVDQGFREPTFSELMRRSAVDHPDFKESLRRNTQQHHSHSQSHPPPSNSLHNSMNHPETSFNIEHHQLSQPSPDPMFTSYSSNPSHSLMNNASNPMATSNNLPTMTVPSTAAATSQPNPSKPMHRTLSFFDPSIMKGKNITGGDASTNGLVDSGMISEFPAPSIPSTLRSHGGNGHNASMYSIANNYPAFSNPNGSSNNHTTTANMNSSHHDYGGSDNTSGMGRKMSLPETAYHHGNNGMGSSTSYYHGDNGAMPTVEIDLSL